MQLIMTDKNTVPVYESGSERTLADSVLAQGHRMDLKTIVWYLVLSSLTVAYLVVLAGVRSAKSHDVSHHSHRMIVGCTIIWHLAGGIRAETVAFRA